MTSESESTPKKPAVPSADPAPKPVIPLPILNEQLETEEDLLQELFDEDKVEHRHGQSEPEAD